MIPEGSVFKLYYLLHTPKPDSNYREFVQGLGRCGFRGLGFRILLATEAI